jgi:hypothetical protein
VRYWQQEEEDGKENNDDDDDDEYDDDETMMMIIIIEIQRMWNVKAKMIPIIMGGGLKPFHNHSDNT